MVACPCARVLHVESLKPADLPNFGTHLSHDRFRGNDFDNLPVPEKKSTDRSCAVKVNEAQFSQSLYKYYKERLNVWIVRVEDWVGLSEVPQWANGLLAKAPGMRCGYIERYGWSQENKKLNSRTWYDADAALRFKAQIKDNDNGKLRFNWMWHDGA